MPAKKQVSKEDIIEAAYGILREKGISAMNMRSVAERCGCSTQPLYLSFKGYNKLKDCVTEKCYKEFDKYIRKKIALKEYPEYKAIGMGYISFAVDEAEIFKYMFMRRRDKASDCENDSFDKSAMLIMKNYGLYKDDAVTLHAEMWIFVHGIATMLATKYLDWDMETVSKMVTDAYLGLSERLKKENK